MDSKIPNWKFVGSGLYVVRTQAGYRQAVKHFWGCHAKGKFLKGYPASYPALVSLVERHCGYSYVQANCIPLDDIQYAISKNALSETK